MKGKYFRVCVGYVSEGKMMTACETQKCVKTTALLQMQDNFLSQQLQNGNVDNEEYHAT